MIEIGKAYGCLTVLAQVDSNADVYLCRCKCGKEHAYDALTIQSCPKYCYYPVFISSRFTYSNKANSGRYRKFQKYKNLMNVRLVHSRCECEPSFDYCELWNQYKRRNQNRNAGVDKQYSVYDRQTDIRRFVMAKSPILALKQLYPDYNFELCPVSDIRSWVKFENSMRWRFLVRNHGRTSFESKTWRYRCV